MTRSEVLAWLMETDPARLEALWSLADEVRRQHVGDAVHLRGLIEISNYCVRRCAYCGLRGPNAHVQRYRVPPEAIVESAIQAQRLGFGTVVLQAGEDPMLTAEHVSRIIRMIKRQTNLAVTLSLGERSAAELLAWRRAGAVRYLLRFETSDRALYDRIHPPAGRRRSDRIAILRSLRRMGYEIGGGVMVGLPGQTYASLANDLGLFRALDLDMIGIGPFIPHPHTPLGSPDGQMALRSSDDEYAAGQASPDEGDALLAQVPNDELMVCKMVALTRILCPEANIPATTALATISPQHGRELALKRGANVIMPNLTPARYRAMYEIYPNKACLTEKYDTPDGSLRQWLQRIGRTAGVGAGGRLRQHAGASASDADQATSHLQPAQQDAGVSHRPAERGEPSMSNLASAVMGGAR